MKVLVIDPGPHVGMATWQPAPTETGEVVGLTETTPEEFYTNVATWIAWADVVVCENFIIGGARAKEANATIEMIGVVRYVCRNLGVPLVLQPPSDAMAFSTTAKLKRVGWWERGGSDHARAASKHLLLYLVNAKLLDPVRVLESDT